MVGVAGSCDTGWGWRAQVYFGSSFRAHSPFRLRTALSAVKVLRINFARNLHLAGSASEEQILRPETGLRMTVDASGLRNLLVPETLRCARGAWAKVTVEEIRGRLIGLEPSRMEKKNVNLIRKN
jgi:hypothetical protein